ncbi:MAG: peptide chain release factor N(5)-glutamine methyltransferase [Bacteroidales bacterium]
MRIPSNKIKDIISFFKQELQGLYDEREIKSFINLIMEEYTALNSAQLLVNVDKTLNESVLLKIKFAINDLKVYKPVQYILGKTFFYDFEFNVTPDVLIPRPETEELVKWIIDDYKSHLQAFTLLDIGTGSGCIPVTLKKHLPQASVNAVDISEKALEVAKRNAKQNEVSINFMQLDILDRERWQELPETDVIISNPPYVCDSEKEMMQPNVLDYEPHLALFVSNDDPLLFYNAIADFALQKLKPNGSLYFEINENFALQTKTLLEIKGFTNCEIRKDIQGKNRMIKARLNKL